MAGMGNIAGEVVSCLDFADVSLIVSLDLSFFSILLCIPCFDFGSSFELVSLLRDF